MRRYSYKKGKRNKTLVKLWNNDIIYLNKAILLKLNIKPNVVDILEKENTRTNS